MSVYAEAATVKLDQIRRESLSGRHPDPSSSAAFRIWKEAKRSLCLGVGLLVVFGAVVFFCFLSLPEAQLSGKLSTFPPRSLEQLVYQRDLVVQYSEKHLAGVLSCLCLLYIFMQTFAIPGTLTLSLMAGALLGVPKGLALVSAISTVGSCNCYGVSLLLGTQLAGAIWPARLGHFRKEVDKRRTDLLSYIIFLRLTPILPNTFINVASPIVNVPLSSFAIGTVLGCIPNNFLAVNAGSKLKELRSLNELYDVKLMTIGAAVGVVAMLPIWLRRQDTSDTAGAAPIEKDS
ncbi:hypothetical protein WJX74_000581 [Apatococcus lobatus]|uniref:VTT domain-containing protein n=2 Tax=Apatococcus TaxID=904362 RepID=A0AAW1SMS7_9CHLO